MVLLKYLMFHRHETGAAEKSADQDAEPQFDLIEPGSSFWRIDEADTVLRVGQEVHTSGHGSKDPIVAFGTQVEVQMAGICDEPNQGLRHVGIEVVDDEDPFGIRV